jgi:hypothetical protein
MATIKSYTDLSQSKTLSKILPLESADMMWEQHGAEPYVTIKPWTTIGKSIGCHCLSCWSLAALFNILPDGTNIIKDEADTENEKCMCVAESKDDIISTFGNNPVDACYQMVIKLKETT